MLSFATLNAPRVSPRRPTFTSACYLLSFSAVLRLNAAPMHPVEWHLRVDFPSVSIQSTATFEDAEEIVGGHVVPGLHPRFAQVPVRPDLPGAPDGVRLTYPRFYGDPLVAELGDQRVVLRAVNARGSVAETADGALIYREPYASVDAVEVPDHGHSEELLLLRDGHAPLAYDYEIVEMRGVAAVVTDGGAIRFLPAAEAAASAAQIAAGRFDRLPCMLRIDRPWVVDAAGRRSEAHARWTLIGDGATPTTLRLTVSSDGLTYPLLVDPSFSATGRLISDRYSHTATLLQNGQVMVAGGIDHHGNYLRDVELYDPATGKFSATGRDVFERTFHTATLLANGKVLIAGGFGSPGGSLSSALLYNPASGTFGVRLALPNPDNRLPGGQRCKVSFPVESVQAR